MVFSKYLIAEILSLIYNLKEIKEICFKLNKNMRNITLKERFII